MEELYVYPAKLNKNDENMIVVSFFDFPEIIVEGEDFKAAIKNAQEALAVTLFRYNDAKKDIPAPSQVEASALLIQVWMPYYKNITKEVYVRKSATIPEWLDILAKQNSVNYSAAFVKGLKMELGIED